MVYRLQGVGGLPTQRRWWAKFQQWLLPARCIACGGPAVGAHSIQATDYPSLDLCRPCHDALPLNHHACGRCGLPLATTRTDLVCGRCLARPPRFERSFCAYRYEYPLQHLIRQLKYHSAMSHAQVLGTLLASYLRQRHADDWPECFVPVPLHPARYRRRGYNQVIELGRFLEHSLAVPMRTDLIVRRRNTVEQAGLSRRERRSNLRRAFVTNHVMPKHIAILDDVITTGSTVSEVSRVFKAAGVERIEVWGLARAVVGKAVQR